MSEVSYVCNLDSGSLDALADALQNVAANIQGACDAAAHELAENAAKVAQAAAPGGSLPGSIVVEDTGDGSDVVCTAPYGCFVEFGTGLGSPAASSATVKAMREAGWHINESGRGEPGWHYPKKDGTFGFTHGQSGAGFMGWGAETARGEMAYTFARHIREETGI